MSKERVPVEQKDIIPTPAGGTRTVKLYSYVATLTEKDGADVTAVRVDGAQNKHDVYISILDRFPEWNIKGIQKLYDTDFDE